MDVNPYYYFTFFILINITIILKNQLKIITCWNRSQFSFYF